MPPCSECLIRSCVTSRTNIKIYCTPAGLTSFLVWTVFHKHGNGYHSELRAARFQSQQHPPHLDCNVFFCVLNLQSMDVDSGGKNGFFKVWGFLFKKIGHDFWKETWGQISLQLISLQTWKNAYIWFLEENPFLWLGGRCLYPTNFIKRVTLNRSFMVNS